MRCLKCKTKNVSQAIYCISCGHKFTEKEYERAKKWSFASWISKIKNFWDFITLGTLKDKLIVRILLLIISVGGGIYLYYLNGSTLKIQKSDNYEIKYSKVNHEYYLYTSTQETSLNLYLPHNVDVIHIELYDKDGNILSKSDYTDISDLTILSNDEDDNYYKIYIEKKNQIILHPYRMESE